jgi:hypothetical protein
MGIQQYDDQKERIRQIALKVFAGCSICLFTMYKPDAIQFLIKDANGNEICGFRATSVTEIEEMSDEQIEMKIRSDCS